MVLGRIGDRVGRRQALTLSVMAMALATVSMAILPTYQQVGLWAPIALVLLRILQGLSAGGEYTTSIVFLAEHAQPIAAAWSRSGGSGDRCWACCWAQPLERCSPAT